MRGKRNACGVCTALKDARGGVASTCPVRVDLLDRVAQSHPGRRGPMRPAASTARATSAGEGKGRAASWISTMSGCVRGQRLEPGPHARLPGRAADAGRPEAPRVAAGESVATAAS